MLLEVRGEVAVGDEDSIVVFYCIARKRAMQGYKEKIGDNLILLTGMNLAGCVLWVGKKVGKLCNDTGLQGYDYVSPASRLLSST